MLKGLVHFFSFPSNTLAAAVFMALLGAAIKVFLDKRLERAQMRMQRLQEQIEQLYGPLFSIIDQLDTCNRIEPRIAKDNAMTDEQRQSFKRFMCYEFYLPLHRQIRDILQAKLYLIDGLTVPKSFLEYMEHSAQYEIQTRLWFEKGIASDRTEGAPYPAEFNDDVEFSRGRIMSRLGLTLAMLGSRGDLGSRPIVEAKTLPPVNQAASKGRA
jgi:hypothetical protein